MNSEQQTAEVERLKQQICTQEQYIRAQDIELSSLRSTSDLNSAWKTICEQKDKTIEYQHRELERSTTTTEQLQAENKRLYHDLRTQDIEIKRLLLDDASDFSWKIVADGKSQVIKDQEQQIKTIRSENTAAVKELEIKHGKLQKDRDNLAQSYELLNQKHKSLRQEHTSLQRYHENLKKEKTKSDKRIQDLEVRLDSGTQEWLKATEELVPRLMEHKPSEDTHPWAYLGHSSNSSSPNIQNPKNNTAGATAPATQTLYRTPYLPSPRDESTTSSPTFFDPPTSTHPFPISPPTFTRPTFTHPPTSTHSTFMPSPAFMPPPTSPPGLMPRLSPRLLTRVIPNTRGRRGRGGAHMSRNAATRARRSVDDVLARTSNGRDLPPVVIGFLQAQFTRLLLSLCMVDDTRFNEVVFGMASGKICVQKKLFSLEEIVPEVRTGACDECIGARRICLQKKDFDRMVVVPLPERLRPGKIPEDLGYWVEGR